MSSAALLAMLLLLAGGLVWPSGAYKCDNVFCYVVKNVSTSLLWFNCSQDMPAMEEKVMDVSCMSNEDKVLLSLTRDQNPLSLICDFIAPGAFQRLFEAVKPTAVMAQLSISFITFRNLTKTDFIGVPTLERMSFWKPIHMEPDVFLAFQSNKKFTVKFYCDENNKNVPTESNLWFRSKTWNIITSFCQIAWQCNWYESDDISNAAYQGVEQLSQLFLSEKSEVSGGSNMVYHTSCSKQEDFKRAFSEAFKISLVISVPSTQVPTSSSTISTTTTTTTTPTRTSTTRATTTTSSTSTSASTTTSAHQFTVAPKAASISTSQQQLHEPNRAGVGGGGSGDMGNLSLQQAKHVTADLDEMRRKFHFWFWVLIGVCFLNSVLLIAAIAFLACLCKKTGKKKHTLLLENRELNYMQLKPYPL